MIYGAGYASVFLVFSLLYLHAWKVRDRLALNEVERLKTRHELVNQSAMVTVGLISTLLALTLPSRLVALAGWFYFSIGVYHTVAGAVFGKRERMALQNMKAATTRAAGVS